MKFLSLTAIAALTTSILASGPTDGDAIPDPNSAVVKLTGETFADFVDSNSLVLAEFFAPWCGYCKKLGPEFSQAADSLKESNPAIKLAQIDCTEDEPLCSQFGIRGYPTLKVFRGTENIDDYEGSREAEGIVEYMIKQSLPSVQVPESVEDVLSLIEEQTKPFAIKLIGGEDEDEVFKSVADSLRKDLSFVSIKGKELIESLTSKFFDFDAASFLDKTSYVIVHPVESFIIPFTGEEITKESLTDFVKSEIVPYFGDINRNTYMMYMESPIPLAYYFYNSAEQREAVEDFFNKLGKTYRGKINFVGLDASLFGRHAELLNMNPDIVPLFAIQDSVNNKKYGVDQAANPEGPSTDQIQELVEQFIAGEASPIVKSEPLPTDEEQAASPVYTLVAHNHDEFLKDTSKDVLVKYYAHWCGHCKRLAPTWDELGDLYKSGNSDVVIARIDHSKNDVETSVPIEGYPTIFLYPANGEIDEKTGLRQPIVYSGQRDLDGFIGFIKESGGLGVDGSEFKKAEEEEVAEDDKLDHDEL